MLLDNTVVTRALAVLVATAYGCGGGAPGQGPGFDGAATTDLATSEPAPDVAAEAASDAPGEPLGEAGPDAAIDPPRDAAPDAPADLAPVLDGGLDRSEGGWMAVADYGARGPFVVARDTNTGPGAAYDIFRPASLGADGRRHPIISWANGTLFSIPDYQKLLEHWASHGFVVIAGHTTSTAGGGTHKAALDWLVAEAARAGGPYLGKLDTAHVGAAGHSQGGGATIAAGAQKAGPLPLTTTLPLMPILSFEKDLSILGKQTAPMLNINATMDDRDPKGAIPVQIFEQATAELVQAAFVGIHEDAMSAAMFAPTLAWFRLRLMGDAQARAWFYPEGTCGLCRDAAWKQVRAKNVP